MSGLMRLLPSAVTGPRLLNPAIVSVPVFNAPTRVGRRVNSGRVLHGRTTRPRILCGRYHHDASSGLSFNGGLQRVERTTFLGRAVPGVICNVRCLGRVGIAAANPRRSKEPLHALDIPSRCAKVCVHVAATDPLCAGRHPDLVTPSVITDHGAGGMRAVSLVIARERRIVSARITDAVMNGIVPVIIVIGVLAVPAAVMRLERVMRPANGRCPRRRRQFPVR